MPSDLRTFRRLTEGQICVMGRKTFESILEMNGKPLSNRVNIVLTKDKKYKAPAGVFVYHSIEQVIRERTMLQGDTRDLFVIGGEKIYREFVPHADKVYLTKVDHAFKKVDAISPLWIEESDDWRLMAQSPVKQEEKDEYPYSIRIFHRGRAD